MDAERVAFSGTTLPAPAQTLGEGPTYDPQTDTAWWFDIIGKTLFEYRLGTGELKSHVLPVMASVVARIDDQRQMLATENGLMIRHVKTGDLERFVDIEKDNALTRSNDGRVHPCGALWFGTMGRKSEDAAGAIYHVYRGKVTLLYPGISIPNAICFSPDGSIAYFTDTETRRIMRVAIDPKTALPTGVPELFTDQRGGGGYPDGAVCDADGVVWCARWGASCIDAYGADGSYLRSLQVPAKQTSCPAFVGANADRLLATTALQGMDEDARAADPGAGKTYILDHPVKGRLEPVFIL